MENNKVEYGFFDQLPIAFFKPGEYKRFLPVKKHFIAGFIIIIALLSFLIQYVIPFAAWDVSVGGLENLVTNGIPKFELKDGVLKMDGPLDITLSGAIHLSADSKVESYTEKDISDAYVEEFLISRNNMIMKHSSMIYEVKFAELNTVITNQTLVEMLPFLKMSATLTCLILYTMQAAILVVSAFFFALICRSIVRTEDGKTVSFGAAFVFSVYARAPFMLINNINDCLGGRINNMIILLFGVFFTMKYIASAERSLLEVERKTML